MFVMTVVMAELIKADCQLNKGNEQLTVVLKLNVMLNPRPTMNSSLHLHLIFAFAHIIMV